MSAQKRTYTTDWEDLRFFLQLARSGNLSQAARALNVNHTTVARRIARLERDLGVTLFDRGPRGYDVTSRAAKLLEHAERMETEIEGLHRRVEGAHVDLAGPVRVTTVESIANHVLMPALPELRARYPLIDLELISANQSLNLGRREADLALRFVRPRDTALVIRKLADIPYFIYGSASVVRKLSTKSLADLADEQFLGFDNALFSIASDEWLDSALPNRRVVLRSNTLIPLLTAARAGIGLAVLPAYLGEYDPGLARVPVREVLLPRELWLLVHRDLRRSPRIRAVIDFIVELVGRERDRLAGNPAKIQRRRAERPHAVIAR